MPFDHIETGRVKATAVGGSGDLHATLTDIPEEELSGCTVHLPACLDFRPRDGVADAVYAANGDVCEVLNVDCVASKKKLSQKAGAGPTAKGEARVLSLGDNPNGILLKDTKFKIGTEAQEPAARRNDHVGGGRITVVVVPSNIPMGVLAGTVTISYTDADGTVNPGNAPPVPLILTTSPLKRANSHWIRISRAFMPASETKLNTSTIC